MVCAKPKQCGAAEGRVDPRQRVEGQESSSRSYVTWDSELISKGREERGRKKKKEKRKEKKQKRKRKRKRKKKKEIGK